MKSQISRVFSVFFALSLFTLIAHASNFADGLHLYDAGNYSAAFKIWEQQAKDGVVNAQHNVGVMLDKGLGTPKDRTQAIVWFKKAANQGHAKSQYTLGSRYFYGKFGVKKDYAKAIHWWEKASAQDSLNAKYNLGVLYLYADEKFADKDKAKKWLQLALDGGHANAKVELDKLELQIATANQAKTQAKTDQKIISKVEDQPVAAKEKFVQIKIEPKEIVKPEKTIKPKDKIVASKTKEPLKDIKISDLDPGFKLVLPGIKDSAEVDKKPDIKPQKITKTANEPQATKTVAADDWVSAQSSTNYTIQLVVAGSLKKAKSFITKYKLGDKAHVYKIKNKNLYKIIIGSYSNSARAQQAIHKLSSELRKLGAWPKKFAIVHKEKE